MYVYIHSLTHLTKHLASQEYQGKDVGSAVRALAARWGKTEVRRSNDSVGQLLRQRSCTRCYGINIPTQQIFAKNRHCARNCAVLTTVSQTDAVTGLREILFSWEQRMGMSFTPGLGAGEEGLPEAVRPTPGETAYTGLGSHKEMVPLKLFFQKKAENFLTLLVFSE